MIELTRLNGKRFFLNVLLIEEMESFPDTTITLISGKKILVKNDIKEVQALINAQFKEIGLIAIHKDTEGS